ncbi:MAG: dihydroorotase [Barnesiella sp.]|nr:dihydroorotase [Barnesiella sp.]
MERSESNHPTYLFLNARIVNEGEVRQGYVAVTGQFITAVGSGEAPAELVAASENVLDVHNMLLMPGCIDEHVHFRDPGMTANGNMTTESTAAAAGGVTSVIDMPNTVPMTVTMEAVEAKIARASEACIVNYGFFIGATNNNLEELLKADYTRVAGVKLFVGSSTGDLLVDSDNSLRRLFSEVKALIAVHAEDNKRISERMAQTRDLIGEDAPVAMHSKIRDNKACYDSTRYVTSLARETGARLHVMHISTAEELECFSAGPVASKRITAETCPHYLIFSHDDYVSRGTRIKCNPAIKSPADRLALRQAIADGVIDTIGSDHAPHLPERKQGGALKAASGMPSVQFELPMMMEFVSAGAYTAPRVVELMAHNPATLFGIDRRGFIREGYYADIVLVDDATDPWTIDDSDVRSLCGWTPYVGLTLRNRVVLTMVNGGLVYSDGVIRNPHTAMPLAFHPSS